MCQYASAPYLASLLEEPWSKIRKTLSGSTFIYRVGYSLYQLYQLYPVHYFIIRHREKHRKELCGVLSKLQKLDWVGFGIVGCVTLLCLGLSWAQNPNPWLDSHVLAPFLVGVAVLLGLPD